MLTLLTFALAELRCVVTVRTAGPSDVTFWAILFWQKAVEVAGICARHGMKGLEVRLGKFENWLYGSCEIDSDAGFR